MEKQGAMMFHFGLMALLMATVAVVSATAGSAERNGGITRIRLSHGMNNNKGNVELIRGSKSKTIVDYHTIHDVLKLDKNSASDKMSDASADPRCSSCVIDCPPTCKPPTPPPIYPCPTCPPTYPTPPHTYPTPHTPTPTPHTYPTPPPTYPTRPTHPTPTHPTPTHPTRPTHPTYPTHPTHPTHPTYPTHPTHPTKPPCHDCHVCPPIHKPPTTKYPNLPSITLSTNCDFCDHDLYTLNCIQTECECAERCAIDSRCSHFTYIANLNGGTCHLKKAFGSGGAWASSVPSPSPYVCGYIPKRALVGIFLDVCVGLDITGSVRTA